MTPITATQQFRAIAYLRWCLFRNGFRRKGGAGELVARIIVYPVFALFIIGPVLGASGAAYATVHEGRLDLLPLIFWGIFILQIIVSINLGQPSLNFDPESLIRFPLNFTRYTVVRLFLGLLSASTIIGTLALLGAATGVMLAAPSLAPAAFAAALATAVTNMLFIRMIFVWIDRWLSTRRAREIFTGGIIFFSLGLQYLNFTYNPGFNHGHRAHAQSAAKLAAATHLYHVLQPTLELLPPGLAARAISLSGQSAPLAAALSIFGILLFACVFLAVFAWRMQREYRGENLSDANNQPVTIPVKSVPHSSAASSRMSGTRTSSANTFLPPALAACLIKEWIYIRRNSAQLYGLLAPLAMVFLFTLRFGANFSHSDFLFPSAVAYSVLGIAAVAYNSFGLDGPGIQFYFLAPVTLGTGMLAKNIIGFAINGIQILLVLGLILYSAGPPPLSVILNTLCWAVFASLINVTGGNRRSITAPKKMDPSKMSRRQASQLSALISFGIMLAVGGFGAGLILLGKYLQLPWLPLPILAALASGAFILYRRGLASLDALAYHNRESMLEELCKAT